MACHAYYIHLISPLPATTAVPASTFQLHRQVDGQLVWAKVFGVMKRRWLMIIINKSLIITINLRFIDHYLLIFYPLIFGVMMMIIIINYNRIISFSSSMDHNQYDDGYLLILDIDHQWING